MADPAYGLYLVKNKKKTNSPDPTEKPPSPPKKAKLVHPPKAYADLTEEQRICERHLRQKAVGYQATNPDCWSINYDVESTGLANLRTVDVRITDSFGDVLPIPENQHVDLVFRVSKPT